MTKVKICGLSTREAVLTAVEAGADFIGFVFAKSKRQVTFEQARDLVQDLPTSVKKVGVFVSPSLAELEQAIDIVGLDLVQIHGSWDQELLGQVKKPVIRAYNLVGRTELDSQADYILFDAPIAGSGQTFDWDQLDTNILKQDFFVAGGLNEDNVLDAIEKFSPYAVDVSSGVETDGHKDLDKIKRFIERVKHGI